MKARIVLGLLASILSLTAPASFSDAQPVAQRGVQVLTRGPVHEAYAEPVALDPGPTVVVSQPPPEAIEELPPDERPGGDNVVWIPGYWAWDDGHNDFVWVSGVWRAIPPGREWVPGYWNQMQGGFRWVPGYWADTRSEEVTYLPEPPESIDEGPNLPAPSVEFVWVPGSWVWHHGRYAWRPGYWQRGQRDWLWVPSHYSWSPRGYVYADGYWDYDLERRGVLFAPVYVEPDIYRRRGFVYSPSVVIEVGGFVANLFLRPDNCHYYFGDYYDDGFRRSGYLPWHEVAHYHGGYDPLYAHERYVHRDDHDWDRRIERDYDDRRDHADRRPPKTFEALRALASGHAGSGDRNLVMATALSQFAQHNNSGNKFQKVAENDRKSFAQKGKELVSSIGQRRQLESAPAVKQVTTQEPTAVKRPRSVIASNAKAPASLPQVEKPPQPDTKVQPAPRKRGSFAEEARKGASNGHPQPIKPIESKDAKSQPVPVKPIEPREQPKSQPQPVKPVPSKPVPSKPEPKPEPKAQPARPEPKPAPHQEPKPAPKPEPKPEPKPAPHQDPKPAPKPEPKPTPKPEPKPAPHPEKPAQPPEKKPDPNKPHDPHDGKDGKDPNKP